MKNKIVAIVVLFAGLTLANAAEKIKAPHHGRIIDVVKPWAEFILMPDRKVEIRFLDGAGKSVAPATQIVTVTTGDRANPTKLVFTRVGDALVSDLPIPAGKDLPVIVQIKNTPDTKPVHAKFNLDLSSCSSCSNAEYACACDH